jgi:chemotaxis response regulator CheB
MKHEHAAKSFPIVCVGGSAGGLQAYIRLLQCMFANTGVAIE